MPALQTSANQGTIMDPTLKTKQLSKMFTKFTQTVIKAMNNGGGGRTRVNQEIQNKFCNFCSRPHFITECLLINKYIKAGKCRRNIEGKIVLSTGAWIPCEIPGNNFKEQIDKWHGHNPNPLAAATLLHMLVSPTSIPMPTNNITVGALAQATYQLSATDHITMLEAELFALKARR